MSGFEVIGLIDGIIGIIDAALKVYGAASSASGLPASFRDVAARLPLVKDTLVTALEGLAEDDAAQSREPRPGGAARTVLEACRDKAAALEQIFRAVIPPAGASAVERYQKALRTIPKADKVDSLMRGILTDLQVLTANHAVRAERRAQMGKLIEAAAAEGEGGGGGGVGGPVMTFNNAGSGSQVIHSGTGDQNVNTGTGPQLNGVFSGSFDFRPR